MDEGRLDGRQKSCVSMLIYGLMKIVEEAPARYDTLMRLLTFNRIQKAHKLIALEAREGTSVLDIGCGTGNVSVLCAESGAYVTSVDSSKEMLSIFKKRIDGKAYQSRIHIYECGSASMDNVIKGDKFDLIIACLVLGELPEDIRLRTLEIASAYLKENGRIVICDELWPENRVLSLLYHVLFAVFLIPNFILTRTIIRPVRNLKEVLERCALRVIRKKQLLFNTISILYLTKD